MAAGRRVQAYSQLAVLFYVNLLSAFLGERSAGYSASEGQRLSNFLFGVALLATVMKYVDRL